ncbi:MAG: iron-sulfur cluster repair di-iron protein [Bacteroidetes bacterium]|nr:iron-sulfur cluster repair di-iron protein [Bacteroidota bacterium]
MQTKEEITINVQEIEPRLRHQTIFDTFESLSNLDSFIIHNNHDPLPVYYQMLDRWGEVFDWEYIEKGPEWWDIRVTKNLLAQQETEQEAILINVPAIEPKLKHPTIFQVFDELQTGESLIIHNDHDPKPVYYQLLGESGNIFTWEYLEQGPEIWNVLVTKTNSEVQVSENNSIENKTESSGQQDIVIDVPSIEPKLKHPTIFQVFDGLLPGESLIIHNDHYPKPVYYQLLGERGDVFVWQYLEQGPENWDVRVTKKTEGSSETLGEIAAKDLRKAEIFKKYGLDFCCGGKKTVREACAEKGLDATKIEQELQQPVNTVTNSNINYSEWNLDFLADYIVNTHHNYVRKYLPEITSYAAKVAKVHGDNHPELLQINVLVDKVNKELTTHMAEEETILFPRVKEIVLAQKNNTLYSNSGRESLSYLIDETEKEHDSVGRAMEEIRNLSKNYSLPEDACASYKLLFKMLEEFESDLFTHIHLENNIMFPKAMEIEKSLS